MPCAAAPAILMPIIDKDLYRIKKFITRSAHIPPQIENAKEVTPPPKRDASMHLHTRTVTAEGIPSVYSVKIVTIFERPSFTPGRGINAGGSHPSKTDMASAVAIKTAYFVILRASSFIFLQDFGETCSSNRLAYTAELLIGET